MKVDNPNAYRFIMQDDIYLLDSDKVVKRLPDVVAGVDAPPVEQAIPEAQTPKLTATPAAVTPPPAPQPVIETPKPDFNYLGNNSNNFLILVNYATEQFIAAEHLTALENILKRLEVALSDVAIVNMQQYPQVNIGELKDYFNPVKLLIMGINALPAGMAKPVLNQPITVGSSATLYSFSFDEMMQSNDNKKAFWEQMKKL